MTPKPVEILLVDDDPADLRLTREMLSQSKVRNRIRSAADGAEALAYLRRAEGFEDAVRPDVILLDLNMPGMGGHEFLQEMKTDRRLSSIPVVVVTTSDEEADIAESYALHANAYVTKPIDLDQFARIVRAIEDFWFQVVKLPGDIPDEG